MFFGSRSCFKQKTFLTADMMVMVFVMEKDAWEEKVDEVEISLICSMSGKDI